MSQHFCAKLFLLQVHKFKFRDFLNYTFSIEGFVYPIACHWSASNVGWLSVLGFDDFAFSGVVHGLGGAASLAGAFMTGPRKDHFHSDGKTIREIPDGSVAVE